MNNNKHFYAHTKYNVKHHRAVEALPPLTVLPINYICERMKLNRSKYLKL